MASSDLLHTHLALAGTCHYHYYINVTPDSTSWLQSDAFDFIALGIGVVAALRLSADGLALHRRLPRLRHFHAYYSVVMASLCWSVMSAAVLELLKRQPWYSGGNGSSDQVTHLVLCPYSCFKQSTACLHTALLSMTRPMSCALVCGAKAAFSTVLPCVALCSAILCSILLCCWPDVWCRVHIHGELVPAVSLGCAMVCSSPAVIQRNAPFAFVLLAMPNKRCPCVPDIHHKPAFATRSSLLRFRV